MSEEERMERKGNYSVQKANGADPKKGTFGYSIPLVLCETSL